MMEEEKKSPDSRRKSPSGSRQAGSGEQSVMDSTGTQVVKEERKSTGFNRPSPRMSSSRSARQTTEEETKVAGTSSDSSRSRRHELQQKRIKDQARDYSAKMQTAKQEPRVSEGMMRESATSNLLREIEAEDEEVLTVQNIDEESKTKERSQLSDLARLHHRGGGHERVRGGPFSESGGTPKAAQGSKVTRMAVSTYNRVKQLQRTIRNPPWIATTPMQKFYLLMCRVGAFLPVVVLFGIISSVYFVYIWYYLRELMGAGGSHNGKGIYWDTEEEKSNNRTRGIIYWSILSWFAFWLITCIILCIITDPGKIPEHSKWDTEEVGARESVAYTTQSHRSGQHRDREEDSSLLASHSSHSSNGSGGSDPSRNERQLRERYQTQRASGGGIEREDSVDNSRLRSRGSRPIREETTSENSKPSQNPPKDAHTDADLIERKRFGGRRYCQHCRKYKPDRTHHCRLCHRCVLEMDHHCPWVANCIGFYNHKYFMLMVFYGVLTVWFVMITMYEALDNNFTAETESDSKWFVLTVTYSQVCLLGIAVTAFFIFHLWLLRNAYSTIEFCEKKRYGDSAYDQSPFDLGFKQNFLRIFGPNPLLWFFPFSPNLEGGGIVYKTTPEARERRRQEKMLSFNFLFFEDEEGSSFVA
eukprot:CAMPEP_0115015304 /NCGR_PEP_ID=MMETSP0216-20121206/26680_1 /TAXON_ID=223996 /ORGANISM="Protocruzia adherens, Strain Boccale" /LENGTH=642 /DNA_ID=CAMNT_0002385381 /DNA_START=373 /DNA_END=2301 /DNA_ORIENTATION=-